MPRPLPKTKLGVEPARVSVERPRVSVERPRVITSSPPAAKPRWWLAIVAIAIVVGVALVIALG